MDVRGAEVRRTLPTMLRAIDEPWFHSAVERLDVRRRDRLLAIDCAVDEAHGLRRLIGAAGELILVLRDRALAERVLEFEWPEVRVLAHAVDGSETFGSFDALLLAPATGPLLPTDVCAGLARRNLRPGGRFVIDLPAPDMVPDLQAAGRELGLPLDRFAPLRGPDDVQLAEALRRAGLRNVHAALGSHLLHLTAPADLVEAFAACLQLDDAACTDLVHALVRRRQTTGAMDVLVHRTQVGGQR